MCQQSFFAAAVAFRKLRTENTMRYYVKPYFVSVKPDGCIFANMERFAIRRIRHSPWRLRGRSLIRRSPSSPRV